jgi:hypothetical protein
MHANMVLIRSLTVGKITYKVLKRLDPQSLDHKRGRGYWKPLVRKDGFSNVTSFDKLDLDSQWKGTRFLLWHISARTIKWSYITTMMTTSVLYATGSAVLTGYWMKQNTVSVVYRDLKTLTFD